MGKYIQLYKEIECDCIDFDGHPDTDCKICSGEGYIRKKAGQVTIKEFKKLLDET